MADETAETLESLRARTAAKAREPEASGAQVIPTDGRTQPSAQRVLDKIVAKVILWAIPTWIRPNHVTVLRLLFIPAILLLLHFEHRGWALAVFCVAVATDPIDGTMARTRDQTSTFGTYVDPIADKLLVAAVLAWVGRGYLDGRPAIGLVVPILLAFIVFELVVTAVGVPLLVKARASQASNVFGKAKMFFQSLALFLFLIAGMLQLDALTRASLYLLWVALALAVLSGAKQVYDALRKRQQTT
jgi:CDP-diacylglycerol--glycerol-3-phosphate 3-phosphatidyltransferase